MFQIGWYMCLFFWLLLSVLDDYKTYDTMPDMETELFGESTYQLDMNHSRFESIVKTLIDKQNELFHCEDTEKKKQLKDEKEAYKLKVDKSKLPHYTF